MNRKEAFAWISENPEGKMIMKIDGHKLSCSLDSIGTFASRGILGHKMIIPVYRQNDTAEFEVVKNLKKMSFGAAYAECLLCNHDKNTIKNLNTGKIVGTSGISKGEYTHGLWTVEGIYEGDNNE